MSNYKVTISGGRKLLDNLEKYKGIDKIVYKWMASGEPTAIMQTSFDKNFRAEGRPRWKPLANATIKSRIKSGFPASPILSRTGKLRDAVVSMKGEISQRGNMVSIEFGEKQILDGEQKRKYKIHQKGTKRIPSRQMVKFNEEDFGIIADSLAKKIYRDLK